MKKIFLIIVLVALAGIASAQTGVGWGQQRSKVNFKDSINIAKGWMIDGVVVLPSVAEINYLDGVTAAIQGQINSKLAINDSIGGSTGNDFYATPTEVSTQIYDSAEYWRTHAVVAVAVEDVQGGSTGNNYYMSPDQIEGWFSTHSSNPPDIMTFTVGVTTGAPTAGDSLFRDIQFANKNLKVFRSGTYETQHLAVVNTEIGFWQTGDSIIVCPVWHANEQVIIEIYDPVAFNFISITGQESDLLTGLSAYYQLDEASGPSLDDAEDIQDGTASISATVYAGKLGNARKIGHHASLSIPYNTNVSPKGNAFSISMWVYLDTLASVTGRNMYLYQANQTGVNPHRLYVRASDNKLYFASKNTTENDYSCISSTALAVGQWYHIVTINRGNAQTLQIFINGDDVSSSAGTFTGTLYEATSILNFGNAYYSGTASFAGVIDEIGIYQSTGISETIVDGLWNLGNGVTHPFVE